MNTNLFKKSAIVVVTGLLLTLATTASAQNSAQDVANAINSWSSSNASGGIIATASGNNVTVTGTATATDMLGVTISPDITVIWRASVNTNISSAPLFSINPTGSPQTCGTFRLESPGAISSTTNSAIYVRNDCAAIIQSGTVSSTSGNAINNNAGTVTINNGAVTSSSSNAIRNVGGTVTITNGNITGNVSNIGNHYNNPTTTISGGVVNGDVINDHANCAITINNGATIIGNVVGHDGATTIYHGANISGDVTGNNIIRIEPPPPTGLADMTAWSIAMYILIALSLALWGYVGHGYYVSRRK